MAIRTMPRQKYKPAQEGLENHPRRGRARPLADDALIQTAGALSQAGFADPALVLRWEEIAGAEVARVAAPFKLQEGPDGAILTLKSETGAAVFLQHETRALIERLNSFLGAKRIARIRFVPAQFTDRPEPPTHPGLKRALLTEGETAQGLSASLEHLAGLRGQIGSKQRRPD